VTFFADEGVERQIIERLRLDGHKVAYIAEMSPGITDEVVLMRSQTSASVLITADKDFGELVFRQRRSSTGVLLIRLWVSVRIRRQRLSPERFKNMGRNWPVHSPC
jgi:predicted nuclease of predicted toxin-antitoxin system